MFAAESTTHVGHDDANFRGWDAESFCQGLTDGEGIAGSRPHGELAILPLGDCGSWLHWRVLDICRCIGGLQTFRGAGKRLLHFANDLWTAASAAAIGLSMLLQIFVEVVARWMLLLIPLCGCRDCFDSFACCVGSRRGAPDELAVADDADSVE